MVDINLIGDDQTQFEGDENEKDFQENYESDLNEPTPSSGYMGGGNIDDSDYARMMNRGGSKKFVYILAASSIILLLAVAWFLFQPGKQKKQLPTMEPMTPLTETEPPPYVDSTQTFNYEEPETNIVPVTNLAPALRDKIVNSQRGINTVSDILNTIPSNINFTMLSYNDGKFLIEFLAPGDADINQVSSQLQQNLYAATVNLISKENRNVQNRMLRQALLNGNVNLGQSRGGTTNPQEPSYLNQADLQNQLTNICRQAGLAIKQFDAGRERAEGEFMVLPIKFKAVGQKSRILAFLQQLLSSNINISYSKIALIANEVDMTNPDITLVLNIGLYRMI
jgi:hypothetical protein